MLQTWGGAVTDDQGVRKSHRKKAEPAIPGDFAEMVRTLREERGLTQTEVGVAIGLRAKNAQSYYGRYERGDVVPKDISLLRQIEDVLGATPGTLIDAALGPGAYALPEALRDNLRTLNTKQLRLMTEIAIGLNAMGKDVDDVEVSQPIRTFLAGLDQE